MEIKTVGVIGSGAMGSGIAQATALAGYHVILYDLNDAILQSALQRIHKSIDKGVERSKTEPATAAQAKDNFTLATTLQSMETADLIIEAAPEKMELKRDIFRELDEITPDHAILSSNTSSLSISAIAASTKRREKVVGLHFFNPAHIMRLVEVIRGDLTDDATMKVSQQFAESLGKTAVICKDTPAFIVNRVARPFYGEAFRLLGEQAADAATIDTLMKSIGFRMGPFELIDLIGCDVNLAVTQSVYDAYFQEPKYRPHPIQKRMVESGRLGRKTKHGFYDYRDK